MKVRVAVLLFALGACRQATQLMVEISTDVPCERAGAYAITAGTPGEVEDAQPLSSKYVCDGGFIGTTALIPKGAKDAPVMIKVALSVDGVTENDCTAEKHFEKCIVARRELSYMPYRMLNVPIALQQDCRGIPCDEGSTCVRARCVTAHVEPVGCSGSVCDVPPEPSGSDAGGGGGGGSPVIDACGEDGGWGEDAGVGEFSLSLNPWALEVDQGRSGEVTVTITRGGEAGAVDLCVKGQPPGVGIAFSPKTVGGGETKMTLAVDALASLGGYPLEVRGRASSGVSSAELALEVKRPTELLLVDADDASNNFSPGWLNQYSESDSLFRNHLSARSFDVYVVPYLAWRGPTFEQIKDYRTVVLYLGSAAWGSKEADEAVLAAFLDQGQRVLLLFAPGYLQQEPTDWTGPANPLLQNHFGIAGLGGTVESQTVTGQGIMSGIAMEVAYNNPVNSAVTAMNLADAGVDVLFTAELDPDGSGAVPLPVAIGRKKVGKLGTSKVVLFGFTFENLTDLADPNTKAEVFERALSY